MSKKLYREREWCLFCLLLKVNDKFMLFFINSAENLVEAVIYELHLLIQEFV
jgi:hypothetical protein